MRASVLFEQGKPLSVEDVELEAPRPGEVLVRMTASGVCHSCLHAADGSWQGVPVPIVLGDEGAGVVEALGPGVTELAPGDHVILSWAPTCGRCHYCVIGRPNLCERRQPGRGVLPDGTTRMSLNGAAGLSLRARGHLRLAHRGPRVLRHPHRSRACRWTARPSIGCSVMTGVGAVINTAAVPPGASMAVFGVGGVGLNVIQGGALVAAHPIIAVDVAAIQAGSRAARSAPPTSSTPRKRGSGGGHPRASPAAAPTSPSWRWARPARSSRPSTRCRPGGTCVLIGVPESGATMPLDVRPIVTGERGHPRLELWQRAHARGPAPAGQPLPGRQAPHRRADHPSLRRSTRPTRPSARWPPASSRAGSSSSAARARLRPRVPRPRRGGAGLDDERRARTTAPSQAWRAGPGTRGRARGGRPSRASPRCWNHGSSASPMAASSRTAPSPMAARAPSPSSRWAAATWGRARRRAGCTAP